VLYQLSRRRRDLRQHNHSDAFWRDVSTMLPDYKVRRKALKKYPTAVFDAREANRYV
jgi:ribosomal protein L13